MKKTGVSKRIREALAFGPMTASELRVCLGLTRGEANTALNDMLRAKVPMVAHDGSEPGSRRYSLVREPVVMTEEERITRRRELQRHYSATNRKRAPGVRSREQYLSDMKAKREANADARRLKHNAWKRNKAAKQPKPAKESRSVAIARKLAAQPVVEVVQVAAPRPMSVEEWLAQGGKVETVAPGAFGAGRGFKHIHVAA